MTPDVIGPARDDWARFIERLRAFLRARVSPGAADDVLGDILLRLVEHRDTFLAARNPIAWMHRVAVNAITDHHRRQDVERRARAALGDVDAGATSSRRARTGPRSQGSPRAWTRS